MTNNQDGVSDFETTGQIIYSETPPDDTIIKYWQLRSIGENLVPPTKRVTRNVLTLYERTRIKCERTEQLRNGATPKIDPKKHKVLNDNRYCQNIAEIEINEKKLPIKIRRYLHNGKYEEWRLDELAQLKY